MIVDNGKYYLYRHIRLDNKQPFYIGIGTKSRTNGLYRTIYGRAFSKEDRNKIWHSIITKVEYDVEILLESNDRDFIKNKEIEFIALYGRIDLRTGILANMTKGGDRGCDTMNFKELSLIANKARCKNIYKYNLNGEYIETINFGITEDCERFTKTEKTMINNAIKKNYKTSFGYVWSYEELSESDIKLKVFKNRKTKYIK